MNYTSVELPLDIAELVNTLSTEMGLSVSLVIGMALSSLIKDREDSDLPVSIKVMIQ